MKKLLFLAIITFSLVSCDNNQNETEPDYIFELDKVKVTISNDITKIETDNILSDFKSDQMFFGRGIIVENNKIKNK